ncbi:MAG: 4Fe-4S dicluster domain-containing protein [Anaerolineae bacterium]|nr:4Fe-4S dicluster domain-containing protein [Anaerolineae bacterium]
MVKTLAFDPNLCDGTRACETTCALTWFKVPDVRKSSIMITEEDGAFAATFCIQCGACVEVCPVNALVQMKDGVIHVRKQTCIGCMACVGFCPYEVMRFDTDGATAFKCVACGQCVAACPNDALSIVDIEEPTTGLWDGTVLRQYRETPG